MVIGIGGVGSVIGQKLHEYDCFDRIILADLEPVFANQLAAKTPKSRFLVVQANAMHTDALAALMREHEVTVTCNACVCQTNYSVLEACLRAGSHYIDMAADIYSAPGVKKPGKNSFEAEIERFNQPFLDRGLAGILCMSGYLPLADKTATERSAANQGVPIFMAHGTRDPVVVLPRATASRDYLQLLGYPVQWHEYAMEHSVCQEEIADMQAWLQKVLA